MNPIRPTIFTGFAPNLNTQNVLEAVGFLLLPWRFLQWRKGRAPERVEASLQQYLHTPNVVSFDSGRSALYAALHTLGIQEGDEVLVQAYTCMVVINAIRFVGATPIYLDITENYTINPTTVETRITKKTKAIIIQHTFGTPADIEPLLKIAKKYQLFTIEDCAHSLGARHGEQYTGTFADIGIYSFGSDKVISCARGGAASTANREIANSLRAFQQSLPHSGRWQVFQHLVHFPLFFIGKKLYHIGVGKFILGLAKRFSLINKIIYTEEKQGRIVPFYPSRLPNALATILLNQLQDLDDMNGHRQQIAALYNTHIEVFPRIPFHPESIYLRYPLSVDNPKEYHTEAKQEGILLGNWYDTVIAPADIDMTKTGYTRGSCPNAEQLASRSINLPTHRHISIEDAKRIVSVINRVYARSKRNQ